MNELPNTPPPDALKENGANTPSWKIDRPNSAITMSGVPATISMLDSTTRASQLGRPYSAIQIAAADGEREASRIPITVSSAVPISGSRKPPEPACDGAERGPLNEQARAQVLDPAVAHVDDDRRGDQAQAEPAVHANASARRSTQRQLSGEERRPRPLCIAVALERPLDRASCGDAYSAHPRTWYLRSGSLIR